MSGSVGANDLVRLALAALQTGAVRNAQQSLKALARVALLQTVGALCLIAALGCGLAALLIYVTPILGAAGALLAGAGVFAVIALAALGLGWRAGKARVRAAAVGTAGDATLAAAASLFKQHTSVALAAALLAGVFLGGER